MRRILGWVDRFNEFLCDWFGVHFYSKIYDMDGELIYEYCRYCGDRRTPGGR